MSYSGGKDSLVTLLIALKAVGKLPIIFADIGLEFPETLENIRIVRDRYGLELIERSDPAVDFRWCCKAYKLSPVKTLIEETWGTAFVHRSTEV